MSLGQAIDRYWGTVIVPKGNKEAARKDVYVRCACNTQSFHYISTRRRLAYIDNIKSARPSRGGGKKLERRLSNGQSEISLK